MLGVQQSPPDMRFIGMRCLHIGRRTTGEEASQVAEDEAVQKELQLSQ